MTVPAPTTTWTLRWPHGEAELQSLGGMLGPVNFKLTDGRRFQPLQVAPWAEETSSTALPGILRRLRGEWPCVPFGRDDRPGDLPRDWTPTSASSTKIWAHGYGSHHHWRLVEETCERLKIAMDYPAGSPIARLEREIVADPKQPALDILLTIIARDTVTLPVALHPTFRLPRNPGAVAIEKIRFDQAIAYPMPAEPGISQLEADARSPTLTTMPSRRGPLDLTSLPLGFATEELLQLTNCHGPIVLHYREENARVSLTWDQDRLPDVMLWISNGGRIAEPWRSRHYALGVEPVNGPFDLGQVAIPPGDHPLSERQGIALTPDRPRLIGARLAAW